MTRVKSPLVGYSRDMIWFYTGRKKAKCLNYGEKQAIDQERKSHGRVSMDSMMTKTLAEIYHQQGYLQEAYESFRVLSEKDPSNIEIQKRLKELSEKLQLSLSLTDQPIHSTDEKIRLPKRWLDNIREKEKEYKNLSSPKEVVGNNQKVTRN